MAATEAELEISAHVEAGNSVGSLLAGESEPSSVVLVVPNAVEVAAATNDLTPSACSNLDFTPSDAKISAQLICAAYGEARNRF